MSTQADGSDPPAVRVLPAGFSFAVRNGLTIFEGAREQGYTWPSVCDGAAECTRCFFEVVEGSEHLSPMEDDERAALDRVRWRGCPHPAERLACRTRIGGDVVVRRRSVRRREEHTAEEQR